VAGAPDAAALVWLPLVGAVVGALAGGAAWSVALVAPHPLVVATAFGLSIVLTGALHVDGFLDGCDAFFASVDPARRLEILRDPRHGTFALAGGAVVGSLWLAALWSTPIDRLPLGMACAAAAARLGAVAHALVVAYGRAGERTAAFARRPSLPGLALDVLFVVALAAGLGPSRGAAVVLATFAAAAAAAAFARARLGGGLTGDGYGFTIVLAEVAGLVALAV
jgi:adenosylcobinamide-GDP ribazoletransferase